jgi:outer membrane protein OmpA-like peptidoglycan-associated protein
MTPRYIATSALLSLLALAPAAQSGGRQSGRGPAAVDRADYLTFAQGAVPVGIGGAGAKLGANFEHAVRIVDGDPTAFSIVNGAGTDVDTEFVYELPALTTFDRFAVPGILETPSPSVTFTKTVEVHGSAAGATGGYVLLASGTLQAHRARGQVTELAISQKRPVRWIRLRLTGGLDIQRPASSFEFSEIIGNGMQDTPRPATHFSGSWQTRGVTMALRQEGPLVAGCYDKSGDLNGTVTGNLLRATGVNRFNKVPSAFILSVGADGGLRGVRSTNNGPFRLYVVPAAPASAAMECGSPAAPRVGCGSIIHGITFGFDSAEIRPESLAVLAALYDGLRTDATGAIVIEGHTSSEGADDHNLRLSERRAEAVVGELVQRGLPRSRLRGVGIGERRPIATNNDESGRSLNRRVEVKCQ